MTSGREEAFNALANTVDELSNKKDVVQVVLLAITGDMKQTHGIIPLGYRIYDIGVLVRSNEDMINLLEQVVEQVKQDVKQGQLAVHENRAKPLN